MVSEIQTYGNKKLTKRKIIPTLFVLILIVILYIIFFGTPKVIGNTILNSKDKVVFGGVKISADLTIPELKTKGNFSEIIITAQPSSSFSIEDQEIKTSGTKRSTILIKGYDGELFFDRSSLNLNGKTERIFTEEIPITPKSKDYIPIQLGEEFDYSSFEIKDFSFNSLEYITSGSITLDQGTTISLINEPIKIQGFIGNVIISEGRMKLSGEASLINVDGENKI